MDLPARMQNDGGCVAAQVDPRALSSLRHGAFARSVTVLPDEDLGEYQALVESFLGFYKPGAAPEREVVLQLAQLAWRGRRLERIENDLMRQSLAATQPPEGIRELADEIRRMEVEAGILQLVLREAEARQKEGPASCSDYLSAHAIVLERLLGVPVAGSSAKTVQASLRSTLAAQNRVIEASWRTLDCQAEANETVISAARAEAVLLGSQVHERLSKERVAIIRAQHRHLEMLSKMRGGMNFEGDLLVARGRFSGANLPGRIQDAGQVLDAVAVRGEP